MEDGILVKSHQLIGKSRPYPNHTRFRCPRLENTFVLPFRDRPVLLDELLAGELGIGVVGVWALVTRWLFEHPFEVWRGLADAKRSL